MNQKSKLVRNRCAVFCAAISLVLVPESQALPVLREAAGDLGLGGMVTIYPDHRDPTLFYFMPDKTDFSRDVRSGVPLFGLNTYGAEQSDVSKVFGYMTFTVQPAISDSVRKQLDLFMQKNPQARLAPLPVGESYMTIGQSRQGEVSQGGADFFKNFDLPPYAGLLETQVGGNAYLTGIGAKVMTNAIKNPSLLNLNLCYTVDGVTPHMDATVKVDYQKLYSHWKAKARGGWWIFGGSIAKEVTKLEESGIIDIQIHGDTKFEEVVMEMARQIAKDYLRPQLANGTADAEVGGGPFRLVRFGWGSVTVEERRTITLKIKKQADVRDIRCIAAPFEGLSTYADRVIQNTPIGALATDSVIGRGVK